MPTTTASSAAPQVFAITELLEMVLSHLDIRTLLFAQRINRQFSALIKTSPKLQQALFFLPEEPGTTPIYNDGDGHLDNWQLTPEFGPPPRRVPGRKLIRLRLNTLLLKAFPWIGSNDELVMAAENFPEMPWAKNKAAFRRLGASWRRMLVSQPPASLYIMDYRAGAYAPEWTLRKAMWKGSADGLRMGEFYDFLYLHILDRGVKQDSLYCFCMYWPGYAGVGQGETFGYLTRELIRLGSIVMPLSRNGNVVLNCSLDCVSDCYHREDTPKRIHHFKSIAAPNELDIPWKSADERKWYEERYPWDL